MSLPVIVRREAEADIQNSYVYLQEIRVGLGGQFAARLADVFQRIEATPELYGVVWQDVRAVRVRRFQYVVYYVPFAAESRSLRSCTVQDIRRHGNQE